MISSRTKYIINILVLVFMFSIFLFNGSQVQAAETIPGLTGVEDGGVYTTDKTINVTEEGTYTVKFTDKSNITREITFKIETTEPIITGVTNNGIYNTDVLISFTDGGDGSGIASAVLNGISINNNYLVTAEGQYTLVVTNNAGKSTTVNFMIDKTKPVINNFTSKLAGDSNYNNWNFEFWRVFASGTDDRSGFTGEYSDTVVKTLTGAVVENYFEIYYVGPPHEYTPDRGLYRVYIKDKAGNISDNYLLVEWVAEASTYLVPVLDNTPPTINVSSPSKALAKIGDTVEYTVTYNDDVYLNKITLSATDIALNTTGTLKGSVLSVEGTGNNRKVKVRVDSGSGTMGINIAANTAFDAMDQGTPAATGTSFTVESELEVTLVTITSSNEPAIPYAKVGDTVTLTFSTNINLTITPTVKVFGNSATVTGAGKNWTAVYTAKSSDPEGTVRFEITCKNELTNVIRTMTSTTDGTSVILDKTGPTCSGVTNNGAYNSASVTISSITDAKSGLLSAKLSENGEVRDITSGEVLTNEGNYVLTLTDVVGNVSEVKFVIDRVKPVINGFHGQYAGDSFYEGYFYEYYQILASGTDDRSGFSGEASEVVIKTVSGVEAENYFEMWMKDPMVYTPDPGIYRVYIKDKAGNISDNYLLVNWTGNFASLVPA